MFMFIIFVCCVYLLEEFTNKISQVKCILTSTLCGCGQKFKSTENFSENSFHEKHIEGLLIFWIFSKA